MKVNKNQLKWIILCHCVVNIKADGEVLKYRYLNNPDKPGEHVWFCNGENTGMAGGLGLFKYLSEKHKNIEVTYKRQF